MVRHVDEALEAGAIGVSTGLIYAPGMHGSPEEVEALVAAAFRQDALYATHMRNESDGVHGAIDEAVTTARRAGDAAGRPGRLQVSHLKAGAKAVWGQGGALVERLERARAAGLDVEADQYPYTAASTTLATLLPPAILALDPKDAAAAIRDPATRDADPRGAGDRAQRLGERGRRPGLGRHRHRAQRLAARVERPQPRHPRATTSAATRSSSRWTSWRRTGSTPTSSCTAWRSPTSRRSCACPGSRSAPMPPAAAPATRSSTTASRTRAATGRRRASSAATGATGGAPARGGGREAERRAGRPPRPHRPRPRPRGLGGGPRRPSTRLPSSTRRRTSGPPATRRGSRMSSSTARSRSATASRPARGRAACCGAPGDAAPPARRRSSRPWSSRGCPAATSSTRSDARRAPAACG